jgi:hypothetical protein
MGCECHMFNLFIHMLPCLVTSELICSLCWQMEIEITMEKAMDESETIGGARKLTLWRLA